MSAALAARHCGAEVIVHEKQAASAGVVIRFDDRLEHLEGPGVIARSRAWRCSIEYHEIPGTNHFLTMEKPEEFNRLLTEFLVKMG